MNMNPETRYLLIKSLERYRARMEEVEAMGWYKDKTVTQNEIAHIDRVLADLNGEREDAFEKVLP